MFHVYFFLVVKCTFVNFPDKNHPQRVYHPGISGQVDPYDQDHHPGAGCGVRPQSGEGGAAGPCGLLLRQHLLVPLPQVQQERGQETRGETRVRSSRSVPLGSVSADVWSSPRRFSQLRQRLECLSLLEPRSEECSSAWRRSVTSAAAIITGCSPLPLEDLASSRYLSRTTNTQPPPFHLFPSGRCCTVPKTRTNRLRNSFVPGAVRSLNTQIH